MRLALVGSTNQVALDLAASGGAEGLVVVAREQSAGRGRRGRAWSAPPGGCLLCSVLLRPPEPSMASLAVACVALAAREACWRVASVLPTLKWPNDLLTTAGPDGAEAKLAGVLAERAADGALVVGLGLNLDWAGPLPEGAASLAQAAGSAPDAERLLDELLGALERRYGPLVSGDGAAAGALASERRQACATIGRRVRIEMASGVVLTGDALDVADDGRLLLGLADGQVTALEEGDVVHLRPAVADP
ncbi:MAG: biotin/acetyl-CoA-carboxylase ligase [Acidimicrobiaceae bacterium]|nr:biotin/acetyl-CoA-carboxylase ligase [Acidimicrobiaceae bacterium]